MGFSDITVSQTMRDNFSTSHLQNHQELFQNNCETVEADFNHIPVMPTQAVEGLSIRTGGIYVDATLGGGGHSALIYERLCGRGRLIGIDQDINAITAAKSRFDSQFCKKGTQTAAENCNVNNIEIIHGNFHNLSNILYDIGVDKVDGVLLDLGVSSHQLDTAQRGFSYRLPGRLDMRMNQSADLTAHEIVNTYPQEKLADILFYFGEERFSRRIARAIVETRQNAPINTTLELVNIIEKAIPRHRNSGPHPAMRSFMALRIAVNDELWPLDLALTNIVNCLKPKGRICVITFHSLEDRIVKQCFNRLQTPCTCNPRETLYCVCKKVPKLKVITKKPMLPSTEELAYNSRAASAKLRIGEKLDETPVTQPQKGI